MNIDNLNKAVELAGKIKRFIVATANAAGLPHLIIADNLSHISGNLIEIKGWFCPETVKNLEINSNIAILIQDQRSDIGYQLLGKTKRIESLSFLDGYVSGEEELEPPRIESNIAVEITRIVSFRMMTHSDIEV